MPRTPSLLHWTCFLLLTFAPALRTRAETVVSYDKAQLQADIKRLLAPFATGRHLYAPDGLRRPVYLIDTADTHDLRNFRSSLKEAPMPKFAGLNLVLHAQFSRQGFLSLNKRLVAWAAVSEQKSVVQRYFVDLREEPVVFVALTNDLAFPISLFTPQNRFNHGKSFPHILRADTRRAARLQQRGQVLAYLRLAKDASGAATELVEYRLPIKRAYTERALVEKHGGHYRKFPVSDHQAAKPQTIDAFVNFYRKHIWGKPALLSIHCHAGRGRTSTFGALVEMLYNRLNEGSRQAEPLAAMLLRQQRMGGIDFTAFKNDYRDAHVAKRFQLLQDFYGYLHSQAFREGKNFSTWLQNKV